MKKDLSFFSCPFSFIKRVGIYSISAILLWIAHLVNLYIWLKLDVNYLTYDAHRHFLVSLKIFDLYKNLSPDILAHCVALSQRHPPFVMMITAPFYFIFGRSQDTGVMINAAIFLGILIFAVYKIGEYILNKKTGLLAVFILTMYPLVFNQMKVYMLDLPLTAIVSLSIYYIIRLVNSGDIKYIFLLPVSLLFGMLIKVNFIIFLGLPSMYAFFKYLLNKKKKFFSIRQARVKPAFFALIFILFMLIILCAVYYFSSQVFMANIGRGPFIEKAASALKRFVSGPGYLQTWPSIAPDGFVLKRIHAVFWYFWGFINWQVSFFFSIAFFIGAYFFTKYKILHKDMLLVWLIGSFFLLINLAYGIGTNMEVSAVRYSMPLLPAVALISAIGIMKIPGKRFKYFLIIIMITFGIVQFACISYPVGVKLKKIEIPITFEDRYNFFPSAVILFEPKAWVVSGGDSGSHPGNFKKEAMICEKILNETIPLNNKGVTNITVIPDDARLWYLEYLTFIKNRPFNIFCDWNYRSVRVKEVADYKELILKSDYIVDKIGGWQGEPYIRFYIENARNYFNFYKSRFSLVKELKWPDNSKILIYKRIH